MKRLALHLVAFALVAAFVIVEAGGDRTSTVSVTWGGGVVTRDLPLPAEADQWELVIHYELRPGGGGDVIAFQSVTSDCRPRFDQAGSGECGLAATVTWQTADLPSGWYEVFVRGVWTDGEEVVFCDVAGSLGHDGEWWYLIDKFEVIGPRIYLPVMLKVMP